MSTGKVLEPNLDPTYDWVDRFVAGEDLGRAIGGTGAGRSRAEILRASSTRAAAGLRLHVYGTTCYNQQCPDSSVIPLDADACDGVLDALEGAYHRLSPGGFVIIDDWHLGGARAAVHAFRRRFSIKGPIRRRRRI